MEEFNGMSRATTRDNTPAGMWEFARNIVLTKKFNSITSEDGFDFRDAIPGRVIGAMAQNDHLVFCSEENGKSIIGFMDRSLEYTKVLQTVTLGFNERHPIELIGFYNYKGDLIIMFCNGVAETSSTIKVINLFDLGVELNSDLELVNLNESSNFELNVPLRESNIEISYSKNSTFAIDIAYVTYSYVLKDGISTTPFYPVQTIAYPTYGFKEEKRRTIELQLNELDSRYNKIRIGILVNSENGLVAYQSGVLSYTGTSFNTIINSLANYTSISTDLLVLPSIIYNRAQTITIQSNKVAIGKVVGSDTIPFQKYANRMILQPVFTDEDLDNNREYEEDFFTHPTLSPDEVYAISIQPQLLDGSFLDSFHIPGRQAVGNERDVLSVTDLQALGIDSLNASENYKRFRIINTGTFVNPPPYNNTSIDARTMTFGYWENEEIYPSDDEYNSTVDYNGLPIVGGEDLRGTPIRYSRMPGLDAIIEKIPSLLGGVEQNTNKNSYSGGGIGARLFTGKLPRLGLRLLNFNDVVPIEVRSKLQGYRINILKRKQGERLVEDISFIKQLSVSQQNVDGTVRDIYNPSFRRPINTEYRTKAEQFGRSVMYSPTLNTYKPSVTSLLVKANYAVRHAEATTPDGFEYRMNVFETFRLSNTQRYATISALRYTPGNNIVANTLFSEEKVILEAKNTLQGDLGLSNVGDNRWNPLLITESDTGSATVLMSAYLPNTRTYVDGVSYTNDIAYGFTVNATIINLIKNVYSGFNGTEFITLGRALIDTTQKEFYKNGDLFINNKMAYPLASTNGTVINGRMKYSKFELKGLYSITNNAEIFIVKDRDYRLYETNNNSETSVLATFKYTFDIFNNENYRSLNDKIVANTFNINTPFINYFPFRVALSLSIPTENLQTNNVRTFLANSYYDMPNNKGEIVALRGTNKYLYIQQKYALFTASIKDRLNTDDATTYLGQGELFDRIPDEVVDSDKGYIGCTSQFACITIPNYYVTVDQEQGKIFLIGSQGVEEISKANMQQWFISNWNTYDDGYRVTNRNNQLENVDNPYSSIGHIVGYDSQYGRLLFTKKTYKFKFENLLGVLYRFDGEFYYTIAEGFKFEFYDITAFDEESITISFNLESKKVFVAEHDYHPNIYLWDSRGLYDVKKNYVVYVPTIFPRRELSFIFEGTSTLVQNGLTSYDNVVNGTSKVLYNGSYIKLTIQIITPINNTLTYPVLPTIKACVLTINTTIESVAGVEYFNHTQTHNIASGVLTDFIGVPLPPANGKMRFEGTLINNKLSVKSFDIRNGKEVINTTLVGIFASQPTVTTNTSSASLYKHNSIIEKKGTYYGNTFDSYVDLIFNTRLDLVKLYQAFLWNTSAKDGKNNIYNKTITGLIIYNDFQCTGFINLVGNEFLSYRNKEGIWNFNKFRDLSVDKDKNTILDTGVLDVSNINNSRAWFDKSNFISTFIVIRMIMNNIDTKEVYINAVNVKSRISQR